jgi:hypothetical protein
MRQLPLPFVFPEPSRAYVAGRFARWRGVDALANPYDGLDKAAFSDWVTGWVDQGRP